MKIIRVGSIEKTVNECTELAFNRYSEYRMGLAHDGKFIPKWYELPEEIKQAWKEAVIAVLDGIDATIEVDE